MTNATEHTNADELLEALRPLHFEGFSWALRLCKNDADLAADVLQAVYLKVLENKARFRGESSLKTWFFSVIRFTVSEQIRPSLRLVHATSDDSMSDEPAQDAEMETHQEHAIWTNLLSRLSGKQHEVISLVFYHRITIEEAAGVMNVNVGTARTHYERAKANLRALITKYGLLKELRHEQP